jgi:hypothetical protein
MLGDARDLAVLHRPTSDLSLHRRADQPRYCRSDQRRRREYRYRHDDTPELS